MNKILAGLLTALLLVGIAGFAGATPLCLNYSVTNLGGGFYEYKFELILDNNDGSWVAGQGWNWFIFGDQVRYSSPLTGFVGFESDFPVGPWTYYFTTQGVHNGPTFGDYQLSWIPTSIGETLSWSGISTAYLAQGELLFSTLGSLNGAVMANFETANLVAGSAPVPEPATYDATGKWDFSTSNSYASGGCAPDDPSTGTVTVTQTGTNVTMVVHDEYGDTTLDGIVFDDTYYLTTTVNEDGETETINIILTLSSNTSGAGEVTYTWTNGIETCGGGFDIAFTKQPESEPPVGGDDNSSGCFIATAAYGSLMEPHVKILRDFRDRFLIDKIGKVFVNLYYTYSPPIAKFIAKHDSLRAIVRLGLLPIVGISWIALKIGLLSTVALMFLFISCFVGLVSYKRKYKE